MIRLVTVVAAVHHVRVWIDLLHLNGSSLLLLRWRLILMLCRLLTSMVSLYLNVVSILRWRQRRRMMVMTMMMIRLVDSGR